jgi:hypothetical protein
LILRSLQEKKYMILENYFRLYIQTEPVGQGLYKKTEVRYFSVHTEQARLIKNLLYGIDKHLYLKQTRNAWFEMHIISVVHIWLKKTKNTNVFLLFH